jgi:hypothetical protein
MVAAAIRRNGVLLGQPTEKASLQNRRMVRGRQRIWRLAAFQASKINAISLRAVLDRRLNSTDGFCSCHEHGRLAPSQDCADPIAASGSLHPRKLDPMHPERFRTLLSLR